MTNYLSIACIFIIVAWACKSITVPAVLGANILSLKDAVEAGVDWSQVPVYLIGVATAAVSGYLCIGLLRRIANKGKFGAFAYYCWAVGLLTIVVQLIK